MLPETVSRTALGTTVGRALESYRHKRDRLFEDPLAMGFLPPTYRAMVCLLRVPILGTVLLALRERQVPGVMGNLLCRTRFIDDKFRSALANGIEQIAILGAGFDSRAYRISGVDQTRVFEVDHAATQAWKRKRIKRMHKELPSNVTLVPVDLERQELGEALSAAGFQIGPNTLFIWEGVTQYIKAESVDSTFQYISRAVGVGGRVVFTYVNRGLIDGSVQMDGARRLMSEVERQGEPWVFGIQPSGLNQYLAERGLSLIEDVGADDYRTRYLDPVGRKMNLFEGERVAMAKGTRGGRTH
jgi:methyltransferase (TIGR00027 family)